MKYDDASWHYGGDFPADLPDEAGATHSGMFLAWALLNGLGGEFHENESAGDLARLRQRAVTPGAFFIQLCGGKLTTEDLNAEGNSFAVAYLEQEPSAYLADYEATLGGNLPTLYHVADAWSTYDAIAPLLSRRLAKWRSDGG